MVRSFLWLLFLLGVPAAPLYADRVCSPSSLGQPCAYGGIAIQGSGEPSLNLGLGNPIHLATGNKYQHDVDLPANPHNPLLELSRHYNAMDTRPSSMGRGWSLSYDTRLYWVGGRWQIVQADGSRITIRPDANGRPQAGRYGVLEAHETGWLWTWPTGYRLHFDTNGYLVQISAGRSGHGSLHIERHGEGVLKGAIARVLSPETETLTFGYRRLGTHFYVATIDTRAGRFFYQYEAIPGPASPGAAFYRLSSVTRPDGMQRRYLYEARHQAGNSGLLTGIEIVSSDAKRSQRVASWSYDPAGRAVSYTAGDHRTGPRTLSIRYIRPATPTRHGLTQVQDQRGEITYFHFAAHADRHALTQTTRPLCTGCPDVQNLSRYDTHGRLRALGQTLIERHADGRIKQLRPEQRGWPGLVLTFSQEGLRSQWYSDITGVEHSRFNQDKNLSARVFANGDTWTYHYDKQGRLQRLDARNPQAAHTTRLTWRDDQLVRIHHPHETEVRQYDKHRRLQQRTIIRPPDPGSRKALIQTDRFDYDSASGQTTHHLPEGGALHYRWGRDRRLLAIDWTDRRGVRTTVISSQPSVPGYRYGNGLWLHTLWHKGQTRMLSVQDGIKNIWTQHQLYDSQQRLQQETHQTGPGQHHETWHYGYDAQRRLVTAATKQALQRHAWRDDGSAAALQTNGVTHHPQLPRDASGLPTAVHPYTLHYGPNRRLARIRKSGKTVDTYRHNAFGHRVLAINARSRTHYLYLDNRVVAEIQREAAPSGPAPTVTRRYIYAHHAPVGFIDYTPDHPQGVLYAIHSDLIGAPRLVTDQNKVIRWLASYSSTGHATQLAGDLTLNLRLPGQIYDQSTGWHDNLLRTYHPGLGQYLEPDPLGPVPGSQALGYAAQQPRRHIDPSGLILFAFDGTRNSAITQTNIWKMSQRYLDGPAFYHTGPGNPYYIDWDAISAQSAAQTLQTQWLWLLNELEKVDPGSDEVIPIDIIGYSRGAALARHFGNQIDRYVDQGLFSYNDPTRGLITACVDLRFMGLFDTVSQFGLAGVNNSQYDLTVASTWGWVAHAVALHERRWLFPLSAASAGNQPNITEAPFIGAHADIGGGLAYGENGPDTTTGDLSDVALNWMLWQARAASLRFSDGDPSDAEISHPILHDQRITVTRIADTDRRVDAPDGSPWHAEQNYHPTLGHERRESTEDLIKRYEDWRLGSQGAVGTVDMDGYAHWLHQELGWQALPS